MICEHCGEEVGDRNSHVNPGFIGGPLYSCPLKAERSGVLQGCLPSTNCCAGAGADAHSDSLINSVVAREEAEPAAMFVVEVMVVNLETKKSEWREIVRYKDASHAVQTVMANDHCQIRTRIEKPPALAAQRERAIPRNDQAHLSAPGGRVERNQKEQ